MVLALRSTEAKHTNAHYVLKGAILAVGEQISVMKFM